MDEKWDFLVSEFCRLGGVAENICQKEGELGRGIFSINPNLKSRIYTPLSLMIRKEDIYLEDNKIRIKKDKMYKQEILDFFDYYQDNFSWGGGGKETVESFEIGLSSFSFNLKELIKKHILVDLEQRHIGDWKNIILREFLMARAFKFNNSSMICPLLELVNHEVTSLSFIKQLDGISTPNYPPIQKELTHNYNNKSSINRFFYQGFFSRETIVFSFPFSIKIKEKDIDFVCEGKEINDDSMSIKRSANRITVKGLPIADVNHPRLPIDYFNELISRIGDVCIPKNILSEIFQFNILHRNNILEESRLVSNEVGNLFSQIIIYEINLISSYD